MTWPLPCRRFGWQEAPDGVTGWLKALLRWLMTIAAVSLGAPFWFDLLGKVAHVRGAGNLTTLSEPRSLT